MATTSSRGIVIHAGGSGYLLNAFIATRMLRFVGCQLPVQWWYENQLARPKWMDECADRAFATLQDSSVIEKQQGVSFWHAWQRKPFSILHSAFDETFLLDADNFVCADPTYLWDHPLYLKHGCLFWPDFYCLSPKHPIWGLCKIPHDPNPVFQGGQQMIDRNRCLEALTLTVEFNLNAEFWYKIVHGEQDTYKYCWAQTGTPYSIVPGKAGNMPRGLTGTDPEGNLMFQHRTHAKFQLEDNFKVRGFKYEDECFEFLEEYKQIRCKHK